MDHSIIISPLPRVDSCQFSGTVFEQACIQDGKCYFLSSPSSLRSIYGYRCLWFTSFHTSSKWQFYLKYYHYANPYRCTIASALKRLTVYVISHWDCPNHSNRFLWLHLPIYLATHKPLGLCTYHPFYLPKSSKIFRCWIIWGFKSRVGIIPSFLAISYIGQDSVDLSSFYKLISIYRLATWMASQGAVKMEQDIVVISPWGNTLILTGLATSMAVNLLMTGLIAFRLFRNSGFRYILCIIIGSGMALFAIQLVRIVLTSTGPVVGMDLVIGIHEMLNVIIRSFHFYFFCFTDDNY